MLSVHVFRVPVSELKERMSSREFDEYLTFFQQEPLPDSWLQTGQIAAAMYHCHGAKSVKASDFKPKVRRQQSPAEIMAIFKAKTKGRTTNG